MGQEDPLQKEWLSLKQDGRISKCRSAYVVSDWGLRIGDCALGISAIRYSLLVAGHSLLVTDCCTLFTACCLLVTDLLVSPSSHSAIPARQSPSLQAMAGGRNLKSAILQVAAIVKRHRFPWS
jgi:hypothetical protein